MSIAKLNEILEAAFMGIERDDECTLHQAELLDHTPEREISDAEWSHAKEIDQATDWRQVPSAALDECGAAMSHATPRSWQFYLPAYMRRALDLLDAQLLETWLPGSVIHCLTFSSEYAGQVSYTLDRFETLSTAQGRAVRAFLEYIRDYPRAVTSYRRDSEIALLKYWGLVETKRPRRPKVILPWSFQGEAKSRS